MQDLGPLLRRVVRPLLGTAALAEGGPNGGGSGSFTALDGDGIFFVTSIGPDQSEDLPGGFRLYDARTLSTPSQWRLDLFDNTSPSDVGISGDRIAIARLGTSGSSEPCGSVAMYRRFGGGSFQPETVLYPDCGPSGAGMGERIDINGATLAVFGRADVGTSSRWPATMIFEDLPDLGWTQDSVIRRLPAGILVWGFSGDNGAAVISGGDIVMGVRGWTGRSFPCTDAARGLVSIFSARDGCRADLDRDGMLTLFDFLRFVDLHEARDPIADFDRDSEFTLIDFFEYQNAFDQGC